MFLGFYIQAGKPCFVTLQEGSSLALNNTAITVDDVNITNNKYGLEVTQLLHISISTRTVQLQGRSIMRDTTKVPVWFLNNFIINKFEDLAKAKKFAIKNFNDVARRIKYQSCTS